MTEYIIKTWKEIAKYTPFSEQTLRKKYGKDMLLKGFVIKTRVGRRRTFTVWAYPDQLKKYFTLLFLEKGIL